MVPLTMIRCRHVLSTLLPLLHPFFDREFKVCRLRFSRFILRRELLLFIVFCNFAGHLDTDASGMYLARGAGICGPKRVLCTGETGRGCQSRVLLASEEFPHHHACEPPSGSPLWSSMASFTRQTFFLHQMCGR